MISGIVIGIIVIVFLITVHELGHAIVARRNGVVVEEFGIGFPPRAWAKKLKNGILFTINILPLGGFVRLKGEHSADTEPGSLGAASFWKKTKIIFAGVLMNWVIAILLLTVLAWTGLPKIIPNQFSIASDTRTETSNVTLVQIMKDGPAEEAQLQSGDVILGVDNEKIDSAQQFVDLTSSKAGDQVDIKFEREGQSHHESVSLNPVGADYTFGASLGQQETLHSTWSAPVVGVVTTAQLSWETLAGLGQMVAKLSTGFVQQFSSDQAVRDHAHAELNEVSEGVAGPIGILGVIFPSAKQQGLTQLVLLTAIISLTLAVINALPIPALDGGRWWTLAGFKMFRAKLTPEREEKIQGTGMLILLGLIILVTIADIGKLW